MSKHVKFPRVSRLRKGYHCRQVDRFHDRVELSLRGGAPQLDAADIRRVGFEMVRHGYDVGSVDHYLDQLEEYVFAHASPPGGSRRRNEDTQGDVEFLRDQLDQPYMRRFPRAGFLRRGYGIDGVDDFVDRVLKQLSGQEELTVDEVRAAAFRPRRGGYAEAAVDDTLDRVVEALLMQRRQGHRAGEADRGTTAV